MALTLYATEEYRSAEQIRLFMAEIGLKYTEVTVTPADEAKMAQRGELMFSKLPMVKFEDGFQLCGPEAIMEHIAVAADKEGRGRGNTYLGRNEDERSWARAYLSAANNLRRDLFEQFIDPGRLNNKAQFTKETLPRWLSLLNNQATESEANDLGIGPGISFTFGDVSVFEALNQVIKHIGGDVLDKYRELKAWYDKTATRARVRMYLDNRPSRQV